MPNVNFSIMVLCQLVIFSFASLQLPPPTPQPIRQLCGQELTSPPPLRIWATNLRDHMIEVYDLTAQGDVRRQQHRFETMISRGSTPSSTEISPLFTNDELLLELSQDTMRLEGIATSLVFSSENRLILNKDGVDIYWWRVIPREELGRFAVIGYDFDLRPYLIEVEVSENKVVFGEPRELPFKFNPDSFYSHMLYVSPDGEFIGYVRRDDEKGGFQYFIYSVEEDRFIWHSPYDGDGRVDVIWTPRSTDTVAIVSGMTKETASKLFAIGRDGTETLVYDFSVMFPQDVAISLGLNTWVEGGSAPFWLTSLQTYARFGGSKLVAFNPQTLQLDDLCVTGIENHFLTTPDRQFVLYEQTDETGRLWTIISLTTGDYYRFRFPNEAQAFGVSQIKPK